jgi:hypothetical protein
VKRGEGADDAPTPLGRFITFSPMSSFYRVEALWYVNKNTVEVKYTSNGERREVCKTEEKIEEFRQEVVEVSL